MIRSLFVAKTGLDAQQTSLDVIANNLANASTTAYKRFKGVFEDMLYQTLRSAGSFTDGTNTAPSSLQMGTGSRTAATQPIFTQGVLQRTSNPLDIAIDGNGFFVVQVAPGQYAYTRDGNFTKNQDNQLVTSLGYVVGTAPIIMPANATSVNISQTGEITVTIPGQTTPQPAGTLQLALFANPGGLQSIGSNLYVETSASGTGDPQNAGVGGRGTLKQYYVEGSNVNVAEELVAMIQAQRAYEVNTRSIRASDEVLQKLTQL